MRFSVVIPAYNVADYLEKCVASVAAQTCADWEAILVDDGSTDGATGGLCDALAARYGARVRVIHQENGGLGAARNTGLSAAAGEYVVFLDSDDYIAPDMLETVWCAVNRETEQGRVLGAQERIPVEEALKAVTIHAAWQYGEDREKGSITPGKSADFVILDGDPCRVDPEQIRKIRVVRTIKAGRSIYEDGSF